MYFFIIRRIESELLTTTIWWIFPLKAILAIFKHENSEYLARVQKPKAKISLRSGKDTGLRNRFLLLLSNNEFVNGILHCSETVNLTRYFKHHNRWLTVVRVDDAFLLTNLTSSVVGSIDVSLQEYLKLHLQSTPLTLSISQTTW